MRVLVTGGAGFIGSHLTHALGDRGHEVTVLDDLSAGREDRVPEAASLIVGSITDPDTVAKVFHTAGPFDGVYHLAAFAAEGISHAVKRLNYTSNIIGSVNLINAAINHGVKFFGYASTIAVYGNGIAPMSEAHTAVPADSYGNAKLAVERELEISRRMQGLTYFALRIPQTYGPWQNMTDPYRNAVAIFCNQIMRDEPITIYGDGRQVRAFTYVDDIVEAFRRLGELICAGVDTLIFGQPAVLNVGTAETTTINNLARTVTAAMGVPRHPVVHLPHRDEAGVAYMDTSRARRILGDWTDTPLAEGVARTAARAREQGPAPLSTALELETSDGGQPGDWLGAIRDRLAAQTASGG